MSRVRVQVVEFRDYRLIVYALISVTASARSSQAWSHDPSDTRALGTSQCRARHYADRGGDAPVGQRFPMRYGRGRATPTPVVVVPTAALTRAVGRRSRAFGNTRDCAHGQVDQQAPASPVRPPVMTRVPPRPSISIQPRLCPSVAHVGWPAWTVPSVTMIRPARSKD